MLEDIQQSTCWLSAQICLLLLALSRSNRHVYVHASLLREGLIALCYEIQLWLSQILDSVVDFAGSVLLYCDQKNQGATKSLRVPGIQRNSTTSLRIPGVQTKPHENYGISTGRTIEKKRKKKRKPRGKSIKISKISKAVVYARFFQVKKGIRTVLLIAGSF